MNELGTSCWLDEDEDELVRELLDDESPLFLMPEGTLQSNPTPVNDQTIDQLVSTFYSGPTNQGIENALSSATTQNDQTHAVPSQARLSMWERNLSRIEDNKYTLKLKCCGNGMADDGYKWRKYGQKSIKNSPYPRSYYRCTNPRCSAKKQVERSREDEDTLIITYEGLHLHFAYPYFLLNQPPPLINPPPKKPKKATSESESQAHQTLEEAQDFTSGIGDGPRSVGPDDHSGLERMSPQPQGLLEDVVPFLVRNPSSSSTYSSSSCSSYRSSPASPSSLSWSPNHAYSLY